MAEKCNSSVSRILKSFNFITFMAVLIETLRHRTSLDAVINYFLRNFMDKKKENVFGTIDECTAAKS